VVVAAAVFLPQAPGFIGTWQAGCVLALGFFDAPHGDAVSFSLLTWGVQMFVNITTAGFFLAREDLSFRQLMHVAPTETPSAEAEAEG
jgi:hypothetical protein